MLKYIVRILVLILVVSLAAIVVSQRLAIARLQRDIQDLCVQHEQIPEPAAENTGLPTFVVEAPQSGTQPNEPSFELLRLRGEVGRLRREENEVEKLRNEVAVLRRRIRALNPTLNDMYDLSGLDTNSLPEVEPGTMQPEEVLKELRRVNAKILEANEEFIHAQAFPSIRTSSNGGVATITMEFYFHEGKLISRKDTPKGMPPRPPNPFE